MSKVIKEQWRTDYEYYEETFIAYRGSSHSNDNFNIHPMFHYFICQYIFDDDLLYHGQLSNSYYDKF